MSKPKFPGIPHTIPNKLLPGEYFSSIYPLINGSWKVSITPGSLGYLYKKSQVPLGGTGGYSITNNTLSQALANPMYGIMTSGGSFTVTDIKGIALFGMGTSTKNSYVELQDDGKLVLKSPSGEISETIG